MVYHADENRKKEEQRKEYRARLQAEQQATQQAAVSTPPANAEVSGALASLSGADAIPLRPRKLNEFQHAGRSVPDNRRVVRAACRENGVGL